MLRRKDGTEIAVEANAAYTEYEGWPYMLVLARDVSERKRLEESLRLAQFSVDHAGEQVLWVDEDGKIFYANESARRELDYTREEMLGLSIYDIDPTVTEPWTEAWANLKRIGTHTFDTIHRRRDGVEMQVETTSSYLEFEGRGYSSVVARNVSERKMLEKSLILTQISVERAGDMIFWVNSDGEVFFANDATCVELGYSREELVGLNYLEVAPRLPAVWSEALDLVKEHGALVRESVLRRKDGTEVPVEASSTMAEYEGREYIIVVTRDITERIKAQSEFDTEVARRRVLAEQSRDGIVIMDVTGAVREANRAYARMLGYTLDEVYQLHIWDWNAANLPREVLVGMLEDVGPEGNDLETLPPSQRRHRDRCRDQQHR